MSLPVRMNRIPKRDVSLKELKMKKKALITF
jgi:hypothetical protein